MNFRLIVLACALVGFLSTPATLRAQTQDGYCAFDVVVRSPVGTPVSEADISGVDQNGVTFSRLMTNKEGMVRICDVPPGLIGIEVGGSRCGATVVRFLRPYWMTTRTVHITYQSCAGEEHMPPAGCVLTLRIHNDQGAPVVGVRFADPLERPAALRQTTISDEYGRIFRFIAFGKILSGSLVKPGYVTKDVNDRCRPGEDYQHAQTIVLEAR